MLNDSYFHRSICSLTQEVERGDTLSIPMPHFKNNLFTENANCKNSTVYIFVYDVTSLMFDNENSCFCSHCNNGFDSKLSPDIFHISE